MKSKTPMKGLYLRNLEANIMGFTIIVVLNVMTPLEFIRDQRDLIFGEGRMLTFFLFIPFVILLVLVIQNIIQRPISIYMESIEDVTSAPEDIPDKTRRRLINLPYLLALVNFAIYATIPAFVVLSLYFFRGFRIWSILFLYSRSFMIGLIAASLSVLLVEDHARKRLIPIFFPRGRLTSTPGGIRLSILRRVRVLFGAGTVNPMLILIITLGFVYWENLKNPVSAVLLSRNILIFSIVLCLIFIFISLRLNVLVLNSILVPIRNMLTVVAKIQNGILESRIQVVSNDELGILGDAGNDMIKGLEDRERIRDTFGRYVTPEIRDEILADNIPLNGVRMEATILFSDLRDFTTYVEAHPSEEVIQSMRDYFTAMQKAIRKYNGLVLQYVGDEIEAVFGVPIKNHLHPDMAIRAALEMRKSLTQMNTQRERLGKTGFRHGIGVYTGEVLAGNIGSHDRLSYSLIGNSVNLASRIQEMTKIFKCDILVSKSTKDLTTDIFPFGQMEKHEVKGYSKPVIVYRLE